MAITYQSGYHYDGNMAGITFRGMNIDPFSGDPAVASVCRHLKYSSDYTDLHDVDEDLRTILAYGGEQWRESHAGITLRNMYDMSTNVSDGVASLKHRTLLMKECPMPY